MLNNEMFTIDELLDLKVAVVSSVQNIIDSDCQTENDTTKIERYLKLNRKINTLISTHKVNPPVLKLPKKLALGETYRFESLDGFPAYIDNIGYGYRIYADYTYYFDSYIEACYFARKFYNGEIK